jgi:hypothetical protein
MAKHKIEVATGTGGLLPFFEEAVERGIVVSGVYYEIFTVSESRKRNGWILKGLDFQIFTWKSDPLCEVLLETLNYLVRKNPSAALFVTPTETSVEGFELAVDDEETRLWTLGKKLRVLEVYTSQKIRDTQEPKNRVKSK